MFADRKKRAQLMAYTLDTIGRADISDLPGISHNCASRLRVNGVRGVDSILSKLIECGLDDVGFVDWIVSVGHMKRAEAKICFRSLVEWCDTYMT